MLALARPHGNADWFPKRRSDISGLMVSVCFWVAVRVAKVDRTDLISHSYSYIFSSTSPTTRSSPSPPSDSPSQRRQQRPFEVGVTSRAYDTLLGLLLELLCNTTCRLGRGSDRHVALGGL